MAAFFNSLIDDRWSKNTQLFFRPWHEHTGWWSFGGVKSTVREAEYIQLWKFTVNYLSAEKGVDNPFVRLFSMVLYRF